MLMSPGSCILMKEIISALYCVKCVYSTEKLYLN